MIFCKAARLLDVIAESNCALFGPLLPEDKAKNYFLARSHYDIWAFCSLESFRPCRC